MAAQSFFTFSLLPRGESNEPSVAQQYPALPESAHCQDLPFPCFVCAVHFLNAAFTPCHCS